MDGKGSATTSPKPPVSSSSISKSSVPDFKGPTTSITGTRPLYSSKLGSTKAKAPEGISSSPTTRQSPVLQQRAWTTANSKITGRADSPQQRSGFNPPPNKPVLTSFFDRVREGQHIRITVDNGAEFEGIYANNPANSLSCQLRMVQQKKSGSADAMNGSNKRSQPTMSFARSSITDARVLGGNQNNRNGNRAGFQTDSSISGGRFGEQRELKRWQPDAPEDVDGSLEKSTDGRPWDQFAANEEKFGLKTDYDENIYTTAIDRSAPSYKARMATAERLARQIERSAPASSHVAEERVMDYVGGADGGLDEEDKYSGVKRQDFPPLSSQNPNKYTPPARRAPAAHATVKGVPVDPAIISSQLRAQPNKQSTPKPDDAKGAPSSPSKNPTPAGGPKVAADTKGDTKTEASKEEAKPAESNEKSSSDPQPAEKPASALRPAGAAGPAGRTVSPAAKENAKPTTTTIEQNVLLSFKNFASKERQSAEKVRSSKAKADKEVKLIELKKFADSFKLGTPVPSDLIGIIAKDPKKQQEIQAKAMKNAEEMRRTKEEAKVTTTTSKDKEVVTAKLGQSKPSTEQAATSTTAGASTTNTGGASRAGTAPQYNNAAAGGHNRHPGNRQSYAPGSYQQHFRGDRSGGQNMPRHSQQPGHLSQRLRSAEQQRMSQPPHHMPPDLRMPPTGPANTMGPPFAARHAGLPPNHLGPGPRLNPNTQEFRPNAQPFYPTGPSAASSPRSTLNHVESQGTSTPVTVPVIKRKVKTVDVKKFFILSHVQAIKPPQTGNRAWEENGGLRPPFDTMPTWKQVRVEDKQDKMSYKSLFDRPPPYAGAMATPNTAPVVPHMPHQHQLPFHLQQGAHNVGPRQSPHMPPMQMHAGQPGHVPHMPFNNGDDGTRMMHSNSAQSYASPRPGQVPMAYPNAMNSPAHMQYSQPMMPGYMGPGAPQMTPQMRNFQQNPQYMPQQHGQMGGPMMMGPQYMTAPSPLMQGAPQMQMYPGAHPQFVPPGPVPPQAMPGPNGYPSPGRPAAPMMAHQGSQQGQNMYGMSPGTMPQFQQPVFAPQQPGQMGNMRVQSNSGPHQLGTSPQQLHQYGPPQHRGNSYGGKNFQGPHQGPAPNHAGPAGSQTRTTESREDSK